MRTGDNIRQRADGRFEARYPKGRDAAGRIIYGCCYGKTYEEAARKRAALVRRPVRELNLLILGAGTHGREVRELAESLHIFRKIAFLDDDPEKTETIGRCEGLERYAEEYPVAIPAVGDHEVRMRWLEQLVQAGFVLPVLVHPGAVVSPSATIGYGTVICARATVSSGVEMGCGCIVSSGATIDKNVIIPDGLHVRCGQVITAAGPVE